MTGAAGAVYSPVDRGTVIFLGGLLIAVAVFFLFYPQNYAIVDEAGYLATCYAWSRGVFFYDQCGMDNVPMAVRAQGHLVSKYPPGNSLLVWPFTFLGWRASFLRGLVLVIASTALMTMILFHLRLSNIYAVFLLFHPAVVIFSRTLMSDLPAMTGAILALYLYLKDRRFLTGLVLGLTASIRFPVVLIAVAFAAVLAGRRQKSALLDLAAGTAAGLVPVVIYNLAVFNNFTGSLPQYGADFSPALRLPTLFYFVIALGVLYPLSPAAIFFSRLKDKWAYILPVIGFVVFHSFQTYADSGGNFFANIVLGQRYLLPVIPFVLLPYASVVDRLPARRAIVYIGLGLVVAGGVFLHYRHQQYLGEQSRYQQLLYRYRAATGARLVIGNKEIYEMINPYIGYIPWQPFEKRRILTMPDPGVFSGRRVMLAGLARDPEMAELIREFLDRLEIEKSAVYSEAKPLYFTLYIAGADLPAARPGGSEK